MKIISWNVNSLKAREPWVEKIITEEKPDYLCLQELKTDNKEYVESFFANLNYDVISKTQKAYNGVSIAFPNIKDHKEFELNKLNDVHQRNINLIISKNIILINCYFPNGNPLGTEKFEYKIEWMEMMYDHLSNLQKEGYQIIITGDFNVIPTSNDAHDINKYKKDALASIQAQKCFYKYKNLDLIDIFEFDKDRKTTYTFFDYKTYKFGKEEGIRIDFFLLDPLVFKNLSGYKVMKNYRELERPSDHCPMVLDLDI